MKKQNKYVFDNSCYIFEKIIYNEGLLDHSCDATYIIHLVNNGRLQHIREQLQKYQPTKKVYILHNNGYKKSKKPDFITTSSMDLVDAFITIFKDADNKKYENVLILEDDFFFSPLIKEKSVQLSLHTFLKQREKLKDENKNDENENNENKKEQFIYFLGCVPYLQRQTEKKTHDHRFCVVSTGTHAVIYSKKFMKDTLLSLEKDKDQESIKDWDMYLNFTCTGLKRYMYYKPLCYQPFPETDNSKSWGTHNKMIVELNLASVLKKVFKYAEMDKNPEKGFSFFYNMSEFFCSFFTR